jgi:transcriptional regulator with XRE-family HTH domain
MIKNARQYGLTRSQLDRFRAALEDAQAKLDDGWKDLDVSAIRGQITELEHELAEYEGLRSGSVAVGTPERLDDLPRLLIRQRIAQGLTQRDLADRLGVKEQQIQRYESDDWSTASLRRLIEVADAVGLSVGNVPGAEAAEVGDDAVPPAMIRALGAHGISREFLRRRLRPTTDDDLADVVDLTARLNRIYGWTPSDVVRGVVAAGEPVYAAASSFKLPTAANDDATRAYTVYSHYLALLTLDATPDLETRQIPTKPEVMRELVLERHESFTFEAVLDIAWRLGVPVLPLADPGAFHAVLWRTSNRNVIVLKQRNRSASRWKFDLLHELWHAAEESDQDTYAVIDHEATDARERSELAANRYAGDVLLDGRANEIAEQAAERAANAVQLLKRIVPDVAEDNDVETADLANYLAHRLSLQNLDWWGAAQNLQDHSVDPWAVARQRYLAECDLHRLAPLDRDILLQALTNG